MDVTKHIICELTGYKPVTVDVSQGDRGSRAVSCRLLENGAPWMIPEGATARVAYTLPDGKDGLYDSRPDGTPMWEISKNIVTVELADQLMAQAGMVQMSILIIGPEGGQLATWPIRVMVCADNAARLTVPENLPPYGAGFAGKLFYGGADGTITPLGLGDGVRVEMMANGAMVLVGEGSGPSEDILTELRALADRVNAALNSDDDTLNQLSEIVAYIKSNKTLIDAITTSKISVADIVNDLVTNVSNRPLSAAQGVALKAMVDELHRIMNLLHGVPLTDKFNCVLFGQGERQYGGALCRASEPFPVEAGQTLLVTGSASQRNNIWVIYDSTGGSIDYEMSADVGSSIADKPVTVPAGGATMRVAWDLNVTDNPYRVLRVCTGREKPLILDASLADHYGGHHEAGDEALEAIKTGRQILVRVPNADGKDFTAIYCPIMMYQVPNRDNQYLYLFYLRDEKQDLSALLGQPAGTVVLPAYGQFQMLLSKKYDSNPLEAD